jgi:hypothetical protein
MEWVYMLRGSTTELERRLLQHRHGIRAQRSIHQAEEPRIHVAAEIAIRDWVDSPLPVLRHKSQIINRRKSSVGRGLHGAISSQDLLRRGPA